MLVSSGPHPQWQCDNSVTLILVSQDGYLVSDNQGPRLSHLSLACLRVGLELLRCSRCGSFLSQGMGRLLIKGTSVGSFRCSCSWGAFGSSFLRHRGELNKAKGRVSRDHNARDKRLAWCYLKACPDFSLGTVIRKIFRASIRTSEYCSTGW